MNWNVTVNPLGEAYEYRAEIALAINNLLRFYAERHSKTLFVRFDVHYPQGYAEQVMNTDISTCMAYVIKKYKRQGLDPYYFWSREQYRSPLPHYHCFILLDGQKVLSYQHVFQSVADAWQRTLASDVTGCVHHCTDPLNRDSNGKLLRRDVTEEEYERRFQSIYQHASYLAKARTKAQDNDGMRNFGMSRIPR